MSGFITAEGLVIPIGSDVYDYVNDQRRLSSSIRSVVSVTDRAAGDTVAAAMATDGRPVSDTNPLVIWNQTRKAMEAKGTAGWNQPLDYSAIHMDKPYANRLGTDPTAGIAAGTVRLIELTGSVVGATDASGYYAYTYPQAFPNGILSIVVGNGDASVNRSLIVSAAGTPFTQSLSTLYVSVWNAIGNAAFASSTVRFDYKVTGW